MSYILFIISTTAVLWAYVVAVIDGNLFGSLLAVSLLFFNLSVIEAKRRKK